MDDQARLREAHSVMFDFVIVGGGSAGCVLAARLSENPAARVLLLEAGPDYPKAEQMPPAIADVAQGPEVNHDWGYQSEPYRERVYPVCRGKVVGGCSATNAAVAIRGAPGDYDEWAALGNPAWSWREVLPYFNRLEADQDFRTPSHGGEGPLPISRNPSGWALARAGKAFEEACLKRGFHAVADHNQPGALGVGPWPRNLVSPKRVSTAQAYLDPARARKNLTILDRVMVDRIVVEGGRAAGVQLAGVPGTEGLVRGRSIVLSAGAIGSPAVLLRSGIGPEEDLQRHGIPVVKALGGVGKNLLDHPLCILQFAAAESWAERGADRLQLLLTAPLPGLDDRPALHLFAVPPQLPSDEDGPAEGAAMYFLVALMKATSQGSVSLRSNDPAAPPLIDLALARDPGEVRAMAAGVALARELCATAPLSEIALRETGPFSEAQDEAQFAKALEANVETYDHVVGTCRMGPDPEAGAVVDERGRVHGVPGLWVVDASVMPTIPCANTLLPTVMIAERMADWLRG